MAKKLLFAFLSIVALAGITFAFYKFVYLGASRFNKAGLEVSSFYPQAKVYLNGELAGETPFSSQNLASGEAILAVDGKYGRFEDKITLEKNTMALVNLKIAPVPLLNEAQILWLEKQPARQSLNALATVVGAKVAVDGEEKGIAPLSVGVISVGDHDLSFSKPGYKTVLASVNILKNHLVNLKVSMTPILVNDDAPLVETNLSDLLAVRDYTPDSVAPVLVANPAEWAKGLAFLKARDKEEGKKTLLKFKYLLDYEGGVYDEQGEPVADLSEEQQANEGVVVAYLGRDNEGELSTKALESLARLAKAILPEAKIKILPTGIGFLRTRKAPSLKSLEVGKVAVGEIFSLLDKKDGWYQIEYAQGKTGWVLGDYVRELPLTENNQE